MGTSTSQMLLGAGERSDPTVGSIGIVKLLDLRVEGIVAQRARHVVKRYLKRVGFSQVEVRHMQDFSPFTLRLIVVGRTETPLRPERIAKLKYLNECVTFVLAGGEKGVAPHPSKVDAELLRRMLAKMEPRLNRVYYTRA